MASQDKKQEKDFTAEVDALIPTLSHHHLQESLEQLYSLEKQTRNNADQTSTSKLLVAAVKLCADAKDYATLQIVLPLLAKKHGQLKSSTVKMIQAAMELLSLSSISQTDRKDLLACLLLQTEGKIFLEVQRARLSLLHAKDLLAEGEDMKARDVLGEVQVETYGSMDKFDKTEFILKQVIMNMKVKDYTQARIVSKKINTKIFTPAATPIETIDDVDAKDAALKEETKARIVALKQRHYSLQVLLALEANEYLLACQYLQTLWLISIGEDPDQKKADEAAALAAEAIKNKFKGKKPPTNKDVEKAKEEKDAEAAAPKKKELLSALDVKTDAPEKPAPVAPVVPSHTMLQDLVYLIILAPHNNEQSDLIHRLSLIPQLNKLPIQRELLKCFITNELMRWPAIEAHYGSVLRESALFSDGELVSVWNDDNQKEPTQIASKGEERWTQMRDRVVEHNIRVVSSYYSKITLQRLSELLDLDVAKVEDSLSAMVVSGAVTARLDRPAGIVTFGQRKSADDLLNDWSSDVGGLLRLVEKTSHLIAKEWAVKNASLSVKSN